MISVAVALATALPLAAGLAPAAAGTTATRRLYVAGYHFTAPRGPALTVHGAITVPRLSCSRGAHELVPQVFIRYHAGHSLTAASVSLALTCDFGIPIYGDASLEVDNHTKVIPHPLRPGQAVAVTITIRRSRATAQISYPDRSSASMSGPGGRPFDGQFSVTMLTPPRYSPVTFAGCTLNRRTLAAARPGAWVAVDIHGHVLGRPSRLRRGTTFTITP